ncbi:hypothetical protein L5515_007548 [Caenorhabditis briggsae]|uniref:Uncharacterized protein n=1 Tax=Caenorhabditis briggsae TaxID=6238 RepID=A0AAE9EYS3_CAEBR|nr:hypothetical protein L5515_007548 [Caenorhabditis briggsae]
MDDPSMRRCIRRVTKKLGEGPSSDEVLVHGKTDKASRTSIVTKTEEEKERYDSEKVLLNRADDTTETTRSVLWHR